MKLEEFFRQVDVCPDKMIGFRTPAGLDRKPKLYWDFHIADNFPLVSTASIEEMKAVIASSREFIQRRTENSWSYQSESEPILLGLREWGPGLLTYYLREPENDIEGRHDLWQRNCKSIVVFNEAIEQKYTPVKQSRIMAGAIRLLTTALVEKNISICLPKSPSYTPSSPHPDSRKIVYWPDSLEEEMNK